jgi:hypothetical protein
MCLTYYEKVITHRGDDQLEETLVLDFKTPQPRGISRLFFLGS